MGKRAYRSSTRYDVALMQCDMEERGWLPADLARHAETSHVTVHRFFTGKARTARTAKKLADALGKPLRHYMIRAGKATKTSARVVREERAS
jgi:hypothetical protein